MIGGTKKWVVGSAVAVLVAGAAGYGIRAARADGPPTTGALTYAGALEDGAGVPLTGTKNIQVKVWDSGTSGAGNELCSSGSPQAVALVGGKFELPMPDACAAAFKANSNAWVEVTVEGTAGGRSKVGAVPYALEAGHAVSATNADHATASDSSTNATNAAHASSADNATTSISAGLLTGAVSKGLFAVSTSCVSMSGPNAVDCTCPSGQVAVAGGGYCGLNTNPMTESANAPLGAGARNLNAWRITCGTSAPGNAYALCLTTQ